MPSEFQAPAVKIDKDELKLIGKISTLYRSAYDFAQKFFDEARLDYHAYKMFIDPESHPYKYNPVDPLVFTITEDVVANVVNTYFQRDRIADIIPRSPKQLVGPPLVDQEIAKQLQKVVNLLLMDPDAELLEEFTDFVKQAAMLGTSYSTNTPRFERLDDGSLRYLGPKIKTRSFFHVLKDPQATRLTEARYTFEIEHAGIEELRKREKTQRYFNVDKIKDDNWLGDDRQDEIFIELEKLSKHHSMDKSSQKISLIHMYLGKHIVTMAAQKVIIRDTRKPINIGDGQSIELEPYPYFIMDEFKWIPVPKEAYGMGVGSAVTKIQETNSIFQRMRLQNIELVLNKIIIADLGYDIEIDNLISAPGNIWDVPPGSIETLDMGDITSSSYTEQQLNRVSAENAAGDPGIAQGQRPPRRTQATTETILNRNAQKKSSLVRNRINYWWKQQIKKTIIQIHTYMDQEEYERITGEPDAGFYILDLDDIERQYDFKIATTALDAPREQEQATFVQFLQFIEKFPQLFNFREIGKDGIEMFLPNKDPERYMLQELPPAQGNQQLGGDQANQPGQPGVPGANQLSPQQVVSNTEQGNFGIQGL